MSHLHPSAESTLNSSDMDQRATIEDFACIRSQAGIRSRSRKVIYRASLGLGVRGNSHERFIASLDFAIVIFPTINTKPEMSTSMHVSD